MVINEIYQKLAIRWALFYYTTFSFENQGQQKFCIEYYFILCYNLYRKKIAKILLWKKYLLSK